MFKLLGSDTGKFPDRIFFAGKEVPLEKYDVRERLEKVFNIFTHDRRGFMQNLIDVQNEYIPEAKRVLAEFGLHPDYSYIIPVESEFNPRALSQMQASGLWQMMPATGKMYGLRVDNFVDERNHPERSARAAAEHLRILNKMFPEDPFLVLASYNNGDYNVRTVLESQKTSDFWSSRSNTETELYVEKVLVYKLILSDPEEYGFRKPRRNRDREYEKCTIVLGPEDLPFSVICETTGITYREFYQMNPHIKFGSYKTGGSISKYTSQEIFVPGGYSEKLITELGNRNFLAGYGRTEGGAGSGIKIVEEVYEVKFNENIESIAFRFRTDWRKLAAENNLKVIVLSSGIETAEIKKGQKLRIVR
jgi:hypothetical protein